MIEGYNMAEDRKDYSKIIAKKVMYYANHNGEILPYILIDVEEGSMDRSRIFFHNWVDPDRLGLREGMVIDVTKRPSSYYLTPNGDKHSVRVFKPIVCPVCLQSKIITNMRSTTYDDEPIYVLCDNKRCKSRTIFMLFTFVRFVLQIPYLTYGDMYILYMEENIKKFSDIFKIDKEMLSRLGCPDKTINDIIELLTRKEIIVDIEPVVYSVINSPKYQSKYIRSIHTFCSMIKFDKHGKLKPLDLTDLKYSYLHGLAVQYNTWCDDINKIKQLKIVPYRENLLGYYEVDIRLTDLSLAVYLQRHVNIRTRIDSMIEKSKIKPYKVTSKITNENEHTVKDLIHKFNLHIEDVILNGLKDE